jgi:hypothetical protein
MQLRRHRRGAVTALSAVALALIATGTAQADTKRVSDGNDRPGRLDIRSASHGHAGSRVVHTISTFGRWKKGLLRRADRGLFAIEISTDGDRAFERFVLVYSLRGRMVAAVARPRGRRLVFVGSASASKPNARTMRVSIPRSRLGNPAGYRWDALSLYQAAGACSDVCADFAPNSGRVLHDITPPAIALTSFPTIAPDVAYDVSFRVSDAGGAGLRTWRLQHRKLGTPSWATVASGRRTGLKAHHHVSVEDDDDEFRVVAWDRHGNRRISPVRRVSVPIDDASQPPLVYTGSWIHGPGDANDFRGTLSSSGTLADSVTLTFTGRYVAWVAPGGGDGQAIVQTEGVPGQEVFLSEFSGRRKIVFQRTFPTVATRSITITVDFGTIHVDGFIVR